MHPYFEGKNLSFLIKENNKPIGIMPLFIYKNKEEWALSTNGEESLDLCL